jgi:hypothetical protein
MPEITIQGWVTRDEIDDGALDDDEELTLPLQILDDGARMIAPDEIVIARSTIRVVFDYPLRTEVAFTFSAPTETGFTRRDLFACVAAGYSRIYADPSDRYGVWGHELKDLVLSGVDYDETTGLVRLFVDS